MIIKCVARKLTRTAVSTSEGWAATDAAGAVAGTVPFEP